MVVFYQFLEVIIEKNDFLKQKPFFFVSFLAKIK